MTIDEFFTALAACKADFPWQLRHAQIRAYDCAGRRRDCPLSAVASRLGHPELSLTIVPEMAQVLGLALHTAGRLVQAADSPHSTSPQVIQLRARLLATLGLEEGDAHAAPH